MTIYTYNFSKSISEALGLDFIENIDLSDQIVYEQYKQYTPQNKIPSSFGSSLKGMTVEERKQLTKAANEKKRGLKESLKSRGIKSIAQKKRWSNMNAEQRKEMGVKSRNGISEEKRKTQTAAAILAYSPAREKGRKKDLTECPYCGIIGAGPVMKRFHFERCKNK